MTGIVYSQSNLPNTVRALLTIIILSDIFVASWTQKVNDYRSIYEVGMEFTSF